MNTDLMPDLTRSATGKLFLKEETQRIIGCAFEVLTEIGHGMQEKIYENALVVCFKHERISFQQQRSYPVTFRDQLVGTFIPDLIVFDAVIVDTKVIDQITDHERGKMLNYLRIAKLRVGLIIDFKYARLEWERVVL